MPQLSCFVCNGIAFLVSGLQDEVTHLFRRSVRTSKADPRANRSTLEPATAATMVY